VSTLDTLCAALIGAPALRGARCRGRHHLFDSASPGEDPDTVAARHTQALGLCSRCPSLARCEEWFDALPERKRPLGVVAGRLNLPPRPGRPATGRSA
jgi:hypothetical protein